MKNLLLSILSLLLLLGVTNASAQTGYSVAEAITVDMNTSPVVMTNVNSQNSDGFALGMQGACSSLNTNAIVYKVIIPSEGSFYASYTSTGAANNSQSAMILYSGNNPTDFSDLTFINVQGNACSTGDSIFIGRRYKRWSSVPYWSSDLSLSTMAAGTYYALFFNYTGGASVAPSDITFEFVPYCVGALPDIAVEGNSTNILDGDDTPSSGEDTDYGGIVSGASAISKTFTIKNIDGTTPLNISGVNITGTNAANFSVTSSPASTVAANSSTTMTVQFTPNTVGENTATIEIASDDCDEATFNFDLKALVTGLISDKRGKMLTFDGSNDYVNIDAVATKMVGSDDFTFETWVNVASSHTGNERIISVNASNGDNIILLYVDDGVLETYEASSGNAYSSGDLTGTGWHHVALTHLGSSNTHTVYLDGVALGSNSSTVKPFLANDQWSLGQEYDGGSKGDYFQGSMDEVRIWKDVRTAAELKANMNRSFSLDEIVSLTNLVAYYQFDNDDATGTANGVKDILGNDGTATSCTYNTSEVAVGNGVSETQTVNAAGTYDFSTVGVELEFITSGGESVPNGDIVITKITTEGAKNTSAGELANKPTTYWIIRNLGTNTNLNCNVKFKFDDGQIDDNLVANHKIHKRGSNQFDAGDWSDLTPSSVNSASGDNHITVNVTSFSQFGASSSSSDFTATLPVELISFNAKMENDNEVELTWETANELNNQGFEIERSIGNIDEFKSVGWTTGNGTTTGFSSYEFRDYNDFKGVSYYRLKQVDVDGRFEYSNIAVIENREEEKPLMIFPNPVQNILNIRNGQGQATIYNLLGQPVKQLIIKDEQSTINTSDLVQGQYMLHIQKENGNVITKRFVK